jgi:glycosyltransferase involved in cell wall biosynthesis
VAERLSGISAFFPCYNDAGSIAEMVRRAASVLPEVAHTYDITVVDDGSTDTSLEVLEALREESPHCPPREESATAARCSVEAKRIASTRTATVSTTH